MAILSAFFLYATTTVQPIAKPIQVEEIVTTGSCVGMKLINAPKSPVAQASHLRDLRVARR